MTSFLTELKRRNVFKIALAYIAAGWLLISIGDVFFPLLDAPEWVFRAFILVVLLGLPAALVLAWVFELTPEGVKLEKDVDRTQSVTSETGRRLNYIAIAFLVAALSVSVYLNFSFDRSNQVANSDADGRRSIAILPFSSHSTDPENALFADGIHDDLLTKIGNIAALKVISRTSVMNYRDTDKNLRQVGEELGVSTVLEGTVQRVGNSVRINVQLIDAKTDEHLWANSYDRELTTKNIFAIQREIAKNISVALKATLSPTEQDRLEMTPTENLRAYNLYRLGRHNLEERRLETLLLARTQFEQAVELDASYSAAYSGLADSLVLLRINHNAIPIEEAYPLAERAIEKALQLDPENADAYASLGLLKLDIWGWSRTGPEIEEAEQAFKKSIALNPNHARALMWYASLKGSQEKFEEAIALYKRSLELDPLARIPYTNLPLLYAAEGDNQRALDELLNAVRLHPSWPTPYQNVAAHLQKLGRIDESIAWGTRAAQLGTDPLRGGVLIGNYLAIGETEKALGYAVAIPEGHPLDYLSDVFRFIIEGDLEAAIDTMDSELLEGANPPMFTLDIISDMALLVDDLDTARKYLFLQDPGLRNDPFTNIDSANVHNVIKLAYLAQRDGDQDYADRLLRAALQLVEDLPRLGIAGHGLMDVQILTLLDRPDEAFARLRVAIDAGFRSQYFFDNWPLERDPYLANIRNQPAFLEIEEDLVIEIATMRARALQAEAVNNWEPLMALASTQPVNPAAIGF